MFVCLSFFFHSTCHFGGYCFNICYVFRPSQPMSQILRDLRLLCACVCVCTNINTQSHAHIFHWSSHFFVSTSICWNNELLCITSLDWFVWLLVSFSLFFFRLIPFIIMELATEHFVYITLRFRLRLSAALYYVMSNNIDKSHLNGNRAECTSCRAHHGHRQPDNFDDENRGNKWNSCRF